MNYAEDTGIRVPGEIFLLQPLASSSSVKVPLCKDISVGSSCLLRGTLQTHFLSTTGQDGGAFFEKQVEVFWKH